MRQFPNSMMEIFLKYIDDLNMLLEKFLCFTYLKKKHYLCTVKSKLMFNSLNFTIMNEFGKGFMKALGIAAGTAVVVTVITVASGGTLTAAAAAVGTKLAGAAAAGAALH